MGVDYSSFILLPNFDFWSRPVTFYPLVSGGVNISPYVTRGIYRSGDTQYYGDGSVALSDQKTELDIRDEEFAVLPRQGDRVFIGVDTDFGGMQNSPGMFEVTDRSNNGGGETTLTLKKIETATP